VYVNYHHKVMSHRVTGPVITDCASVKQNQAICATA